MLLLLYDAYSFGEVKSLEEDSPHPVSCRGCATSHRCHSPCDWNFQHSYRESWQWASWSRSSGPGSWW